MTQEDKELLLKDLSARLSYGIKCTTKSLWNGIYTIVGYKDNRFFLDCPIYDEGDDEWMIESIVPYFRSMSSMTEEERNELSHYDNSVQRTDFFYSHHIDCRFMIEKGLAIEAPEGMYKF